MYGVVHLLYGVVTLDSVIMFKSLGDENRENSSSPVAEYQKVALGSRHNCGREVAWTIHIYSAIVLLKVKS